MRKFYFSFSVVAVALVSSFLFGFYAVQKYDYHMDEFFSHGHANSAQGPSMSKGIFDNNWHPSSEFHHYVTVQEGERFSYPNIFGNLKNSVHPPLFYMLMHTLCSFFPDVFSKWIGISLNYGIFILLHIAFYFLMRRITGDKKVAVLACLALGLSHPILNIALYIRSYLLVMLWSILFVYSSLKIGQENKKRHIGVIYLIALAGFLTHYYFIIFAFFATVFFAIPMFWKKAYQKMLCYVSSVLAAFFTLFAVFPTAYHHLLRSPRGVEAGVNLHSNIHGNLLSFLSGFHTYMLNRFFDERSLCWVKALLLFLALALLASAVLYLFKNRAYFKKPLHYIADLPPSIKAAALFLFISFCYFSCVYVIAPYKSIQYYAPILPLFPASLFLLIHCVSRRFHLKFFLFYILLAFLLAGVIFKQNIYIFPFTPKKAHMMALAENKPVFVVVQYDWVIHSWIDVLMKSEKTYAVSDLNDINASLSPVLNQMTEKNAILILEKSVAEKITQKHQNDSKADARLFAVDLIRSNKNIRYLFNVDRVWLHFYVYQITPRKESP